MIQKPNNKKDVEPIVLLEYQLLCLIILCSYGDKSKCFIDNLEELINSNENLKGYSIEDMREELSEKIKNNGNFINESITTINGTGKTYITDFILYISTIFNIDDVSINTKFKEILKGFIDGTEHYTIFNFSEDYKKEEFKIYNIFDNVSIMDSDNRKQLRTIKDFRKYIIYLLVYDLLDYNFARDKITKLQEIENIGDPDTRRFVFVSFIENNFINSNADLSQQLIYVKIIDKQTDTDYSNLILSEKHIKSWKKISQVDKKRMIGMIRSGETVEIKKKVQDSENYTINKITCSILNKTKRVITSELKIMLCNSRSAYSFMSSKENYENDELVVLFYKFLCIIEIKAIIKIIGIMKPLLQVESKLKDRCIKLYTHYKFLEEQDIDFQKFQIRYN